MRKVILGVGNILMSDEGIGVHIVNELKASELNSSVGELEIVDGGTLGIDLIPVIEKADKLIIVDAVKNGGNPGTIYKFKFKECHLNIEKNKFSLHQIDLIDTLKIMQIQNKLPEEIVLIGIEPKNLGWGENLSEELKEKIPQIKKILEEEVRDACCPIKTS